MARGWQVLDLTGDPCAIRYRRGMLQIVKDGEVAGQVMLADLAVVLLGHQASCSSGALAAAMSHDVSVLICDWRGVPTGGAYAWTETTRVGARHRAQASLTLPRTKNAWGRVTRAKIRGQAHTLDLLGIDGGEALRSLAGTVRSGDPENREAQAARFYWARLFPGEEFSRVPGADIGRNALLNYGYTVLRGHGIRAVLAAGLSPSLGVFHHGRSNHFSLVDDLMEPFRPAVDHVVAGLGEEQIMEDPNVRHVLVDASRVGFGNRRRLVTEFDQLAQQFGRYCEGDIEKLPVPEWTGPDTPDDDE